MPLRALLVLALLAGCGGGESGTGRAAERRPSILFLSVDTLAAGHTSLHGYARRTTPRLEELAREAVVFERCLANAPYTSPSYASQLTGCLPTCSWIDPAGFRERHGRKPEIWQTWRVPEGRVTLAETLQAAGYRTAAFVDNPMAGPAFGFDQGFELYDMDAAEIPARDSEGGIRAVVPRLLAWIDGLPGDGPFFAFVNVLDVHEPSVPPADFADRFAADGLGEPDEELPVGRRGLFGVIPHTSVETYLGAPPYPERMRTAPLVARYDEEVLAVDDAFGKLLDALRARGLLAGLLLVFSADHGEAMGRAEYKFGHGTHVDEVLHVPLVLKLPGGELGGRRIAEPVQLLDLYPTLADWLALAPPADLAGRSLVPLLRGGALGTTRFVHEGGRLSSSSITDGEWRLLVTHPGSDLGGVLSCARGRAWLAEHHPELGPDYFAEHGIAGALRLNPAARAVLEEASRDLSGPFVELYHLPSDPYLRRDLAAERPEIVARLRGALAEAQARSAAERARGPVGEELLEAPASAEELRELGYAGDEGG